MPDDPREHVDDALSLGRCEMLLRDGRLLDLSGLTVGDALARLRQAGITPLDVVETRHFVSVKKEPR